MTSSSFVSLNGVFYEIFVILLFFHRRIWLSSYLPTFWHICTSYTLVVLNLWVIYILYFLILLHFYGVYKDRTSSSIQSHDNWFSSLRSPPSANGVLLRDKIYKRLFFFFWSMSYERLNRGRRKGRRRK